ncbi:MarC family protein, partial [Bacteroides ovatus]|uniref:MarC family protein n=1 Tax=Bacteroides ovatus TaxID=28116 RepID=UPI00233F632A
LYASFLYFLKRIVFVKRHVWFFRIYITLMEDAPEHIFKIALVCVIALVCLLSFIILCVSTRLLKILGETGNNVMMRLMGLILMVIAVECFINGMQPVLTDILRQAHACP